MNNPLMNNGEFYFQINDDTVKSIEKTLNKKQKNFKQRTLCR